MELSNIVGSVAALLIVMGYLPQTIMTIRSRKTDSISLVAFLMLTVGSGAFALQGWMTGNVPLLVTNALSAVLNSIVVFIKLSNDAKAKRGE